MMLDPVTRSCGAALISTVLAHNLASRQHEAISEVVCWTTLSIVFIVGNRLRWSPTTPTVDSRRPKESASFWVASLCFSVVVCYRAEIGVVQLLPLLTPCLLIAERKHALELSTTKLNKLSSLTCLDKTVCGGMLTAVLAIFAMPRGSPVDVILSCIPVVAFLVACFSLSEATVDGPRILQAPEQFAIPLCIRLVPCLLAVLAVQAALFGLSGLNISSIFFLGLAKTSSWCFLAQATRYTSWTLPTSILTFSVVSTIDPFKQFSEARCLSQVIASFLLIRQIIHLLPQKAKTRAALWTFVLLSLGPYLANVLAIVLAHDTQFPHSDSAQQHPVELIVQNATKSFEHLLQAQSRSYGTARDEYRRRYGMEPPQGFEAWYDFAVSNESPFIDEFDTIVNEISPFLRLSGEEVLKVMADIEKEGNGDIWFCTFHGDTAKTVCSNPYRSFDRNIEHLFNQLLGSLRGILPDVKFLVNHLDEPMVLIPPAPLDDKSSTNIHSSELSRQPTWETLTKFCAPQRTDTTPDAVHQIETYGIPFVMDRLEATDLCQHPDYGNMHGLAHSPTSFRLLEGLVPILSTGAMSTMGDILFPSPAYMESVFRYDEATDIDWESKQNVVYWAGSTTGGYAKDDQWRNYHRQRFVELAQNLESRKHPYFRNKGGAIDRVMSSFFNTRLFDVYFARVVQCQRKYCRDQRAYFNIKSWADKDRALRSRLVFDLDGNGISGRYYKLLASRSLPLKQTLFREWHDERLMPWVHYIPISMGLEEVPELVSYLTSTEAGQLTAKAIAEQGRVWFSRAFRDVDQTIYVYRLMLELARLQDPERRAL